MSQQRKSGIRSLLALCCGFLLLAGPGCSTILQGVYGGRPGTGPAIYGGMRAIGHHCADLSHEVEVDTLATVWMVLDIPFSLLADTLILPGSLINELALEERWIGVLSFHEMWGKKR